MPGPGYRGIAREHGSHVKHAHTKYPMLALKQHRTRSGAGVAQSPGEFLHGFGHFPGTGCPDDGAHSGLNAVGWTGPIGIRHIPGAIRRAGIVRRARTPNHPLSLDPATGPPRPGSADQPLVHQMRHQWGGYDGVARIKARYFGLAVQVVIKEVAPLL